MISCMNKQVHLYRDERAIWNTALLLISDLQYRWKTYLLSLLGVHFKSTRTYETFWVWSVADFIFIKRKKPTIIPILKFLWRIWLALPVFRTHIYINPAPSAELASLIVRGTLNGSLIRHVTVSTIHSTGGRICRNMGRSDKKNIAREGRHVVALRHS